MHQNNLYQTSKRFLLNIKTIGQWVAGEGKIKNSKKASKCVKHARRCQFPEMEEELYREYKKLRKQGYKVKGFWFRIRGKQILQQMNPDVSFQFSESWFDGFKSRNRISLRRPTNVCQKPAADKREAVQQFQLLMKRGQHDLLGVLHCNKLLMLTRPPCHSLLPVVGHMQIPVTKQYGFVVALQVWTSDNAPSRSHFLQMVNRG